MCLDGTNLARLAEDLKDSAEWQDALDNLWAGVAKVLTEITEPEKAIRVLVDLLEGRRGYAGRPDLCPGYQGQQDRPTHRECRM